MENSRPTLLHVEKIALFNNCTIIQNKTNQIKNVYNIKKTIRPESTQHHVRCVPNCKQRVVLLSKIGAEGAQVNSRESDKMGET